MLPRLCYRLENNKPKIGATSIQTDEELDLFKECMRVLIVPQKLPNGKISTQILKPVRVYFEDATDEHAAEIPMGKTVAKKVLYPHIPFSQTSAPNLHVIRVCQGHCTHRSAELKGCSLVYSTFSKRST